MELAAGKLGRNLEFVLSFTGRSPQNLRWQQSGSAKDAKVIQEES